MPPSETASVETGQPCDLSPTLVTCHRLGYLSPSLPHAGGLEPGSAPCHFQNRSGVQQMGEITFHWLLAASSSPWGSVDVPHLVSACHQVGMTIGPLSWQALVSAVRPPPWPSLRHCLKCHNTWRGRHLGKAVASLPPWGLHSLGHATTRQNPDSSGHYCWRVWDWGFEPASYFELQNPHGAYLGSAEPDEGIQLPSTWNRERQLLRTYVVLVNQAIRARCLSCSLNQADLNLWESPSGHKQA